MDASFTSLLNNSVYDDVEELCSQSRHQDPAKQRKGRSKNFTMEEDMLLISDWLNISLDPVQGTNQTQMTYWSRISAYFNEHKTFESDRTPTSLCNRWSAIQTSVSKFVGYYNQINGKNASCLTEQNKIGQTMEMYQKFMKSPFPFMRCWMELRNLPKFASNVTKKSKAAAKDNQPSSPSTESPMSTNMLESKEGMERPIGRKAAKKMKRSRNETTEDEFVEIFKKMKEEARIVAISRTESINTIMKIEEERQARERVQLEILKAKEERESQIYEAFILAIDTGGMEPEVVQYYQALKNKILSKAL